MSAINLDPQPGFVVKTLYSSGPKQGKKIFINLCSDARIPEPADGYGSQVIARVEAGEDYIVPIVTSSAERNTFDKVGRESFVWDCIMHPQVIRESIKNPNLRLLVVETCLEIIEDRVSATLSREYSQPKMVQKGELERVTVNESDLKQGSGLGMTQSIDNFAKTVLSQETENNEQPKKVTKGPLIQVIGEKEEENVSEEEPRLDYKILPFNGDGNNNNNKSPKYCIKVDGKTIDTTNQVRLNETGKNITINNTTINLPIVTNKIEPYFITKSQQMHIFIY